MDSTVVALEFVDRINDHDVSGLAKLMTKDHAFVDSLGAKATRPAIEQGWRQYFEMVPDYWIEIERAFGFGDTAILLGRAGGTYVGKGGARKQKNRWETPAVWVARIKGRKIAEWRIYADNEPIREKMKEGNRLNP